MRRMRVIAACIGTCFAFIGQGFIMIGEHDQYAG
jgi:hypothetical protein